MSERVNIGKAAPLLYKAVANLDAQSADAARAAGLSEGFCHLLRLRASQINQCAFCLRTHARDAIAGGESHDRVSVLPAWRETQYFTDKEHAALELTGVPSFYINRELCDVSFGMNRLRQSVIAILERSSIELPTAEHRAVGPF